MCPANHINSRSLLRSSSTREPSDPPHRVVNVLFYMLLLSVRDNNKKQNTNATYKCDLKNVINKTMLDGRYSYER